MTRPRLTPEKAEAWETELVYLLARLKEMHRRVEGELSAGNPSDLGLLRYFLDIHREGLWLRDAGTWWVTRSHSWGEMARATGVADATLQSRIRVWGTREGRK